MPGRVRSTDPTREEKTTEYIKISPAQFTEYMNRTGELTQDIGSAIDGEEAVRCGLIDELGGLSKALGYLHNAIKGDG